MLTEGIANLLALINHILVALGYDRESTYYGYCFCIQLGFSNVLYMIMLFMTIDRLIAVILTFKYPLYWTVSKTKKVIVVIWIFGVFITIIYMILFAFKGRWYIGNGYLFTTLSTSCFFILTAVVTYSFIFWEYKKSRESRAQYFSSPEGREQISLTQTFLKSRFYITVLIVFTYLVFNTIPRGMYLLKDGRFYDNADITVMILLYLGFTSDALIYIFLQNNVRKRFLMMICCRKDTGSSYDRGAILHIANRTATTSV